MTDGGETSLLASPSKKTTQNASVTSDDHLTAAARFG
jgi:hypothetical protein